MFDALADRFEGIFKKLRSRGKLTDKEIDEVAPRAAGRAPRGRRERRRRPQLHRPRQGTRAWRRGHEEPEPGAAGHQDRQRGAGADPRGHHRQAHGVVEAPERRDDGGPAGLREDHRVGQARQAPGGRRGVARCSSAPTSSVRRRSNSSACSASAPACPCSRSRPIRSRSRAASLDEAARLGRDVVIVDTAGRLQVDVELMDELREVRDAVQPQRHAARGRRDDRAGSGQRRDRVRPGRRTHRRDAHQDRRRRPRWRRALGEGSGGQAHPLRGHRREARRLRAVPPRPHGEPHPRDGRRAHAHREGRGHLRPDGDGADRGEAPQGPAHARGLPRPDAPGQEDGPDPEHHRDAPRDAQGAEGRRDRRGRDRPHRGDHLLDDPRRAPRPVAHQRLAPGAHRAGERGHHPGRERPAQAVQDGAADDALGAAKGKMPKLPSGELPMPSPER